MHDDHSKTGLLLIAILVNTSVFVLLSLLHVYWAFGGRHWYEAVLPTNSSGLNRLHPGGMWTVMVAGGLLFFALVTVGNYGVFAKIARTTYFGYGALVISILFFLRAIGDFKLVGFFKTIRYTRFAMNDSRIFSPLCLLISLLSLFIYLACRER